MRPSFAARLVKTAIRFYTYPRRRKQTSLSESISQTVKPYRPPADCSWERIDLGGVPAEVLSPPDPIGKILHFHGGGRTCPLNGLYRRTAELYARRLSQTVYSIDYRTGANKVHPALLDDCFSALSALAKRENLSDFAAIGDSMGANLMLAACMKLRDTGAELPRALIAVSPFADLSASGLSYVRNARRDPLYALPWHMSVKKHGYKLRRVPPYAGDTPLTDPFLSPAFGDYTGFPPILIQVGECETSESDAEAVFYAAKRCGADAELSVYEGMFHDFQILAPFLRESKEAFAEARRFLS